MPDAAREAAAYWFARIHSGSFTFAERERFLQWRQADADHDREYRALQSIWSTAGQIPAPALREWLAEPVSLPAPPRQARRRWLIGAGAASVTALLALAAVQGWSPRFGGSAERHVTLPGERRQVVLPDGSVVQMNVATELVVRYATQRRSIDLVRGEAAFVVTPDATRPFVVQAGEVTARVTGTVFTVRRDLERVVVVVASGSVALAAGPWWRARQAALSAGMAAHAGPGRRLSVEPTDASVALAWREGKLVFRDQPLQEVVREMNRYLPQPIRLMDSRLKTLRLNGVFNIDEAQGFLQALQDQVPMLVVRRPDGGANLSLLR